MPPLKVAVGVPAEALRRRPDIRLAERQLASQTARVGVATADLYPKFTLVGSIGLETLSLGDVFSASGLAYLIGPGVSWPVFDAGAIQKQHPDSDGAPETGTDPIRISAILTALEEVENALVAYAEEQNRVKALEASTGAAERAVSISQSQYQAGLTDFTSVLDAQRSLLSFQEQLAQSKGAVTSNLVRLYKALGGGWKSFEGTASPQDDFIGDGQDANLNGKGHDNTNSEGSQRLPL